MRSSRPFWRGVALTAGGPVLDGPGDARSAVRRSGQKPLVEMNAFSSSPQSYSFLAMNSMIILLVCRGVAVADVGATFWGTVRLNRPGMSGAVQLGPRTRLGTFRT